jgi:hypothetical protein
VPVTDVNVYSGDRQNQLFRQIWVPSGVSVPIHSLNWRYDAQLIQDFLPANISCVEYQIHSLERLMYLRSQHPVGIRNKPNHCSIRLSSHASYIR